MLIHLVADYGLGDLAFAEVAQRLATRIPGAAVVGVPVPAFDTVSAGFCVAQLALNDGPPARIVFHNVAPRSDDEDARPDNEGERLSVAQVGEVLVVGPNAGHVLSFLRDGAPTLHEVDVPAGGSQFRSRDLFPDAIADLVAGRDVRGAAIPLDRVPPPPSEQVVYVDGFGNVKTSWTAAPADEGTTVAVTIGRTTLPAVVSDGTFAVPQGTLSFAPGSSGWPTADGGRRRFFELLLRGGSAAERFGGARAGDRVEIGEAEGRQGQPVGDGTPPPAAGPRAS